MGFAVIFAGEALLIKPLAHFEVRLILLSLFSAIIIAAALFFVACTASQTAPLLVILLAAITTVNALFYGRRVRQKALINNLE